MGQYCAVDLSLFAVILIVFETVLLRAATAWFPQEAWTVSLVPAITAIVMVRWGPWAGLHALLGGVVTALVSRARLQQYFVYGVGNLAGLATLLLLRDGRWKKLQASALYNFLFAALTVLCMQAGRMLVALVVGAPAEGLLLFITTDSVTYIFTLVILWIAARLDGLLEDQRHYLARINDPAGKEDGFR